MTATEFMKKLQEGLDKVPDSDGEAGYAFATEPHDLKNDKFATLDVIALIDDCNDVETHFEVLIIKKSPR